MLWSAIALYASGTLALAFAEMRDSTWRYALKPLLALGFVASAVVAVMLAQGVGTPGLPFAYVAGLVSGLMACALGDVLLLKPGSGRAFVAGMAAFGLGHLLYAVAFLALGVGWRPGLFLLVGALVVVGARQIPADIAPSLRLPTRAYMGVIALMVGTAYGTGFATWLVLPALAFAVSDMVVARDRFRGRRPWHPWAITPLYFGAQLAFALSPLWFA